MTPRAVAPGTPPASAAAAAAIASAQTTPASHSKPVGGGKRLLAILKSPFLRFAKNNPQTIRLAIFFLCYFVFLGPLLVALGREFAYFFNHYEPKAHPSLVLPIMSQGGPKFLVALSEWLICLLVLYLLFRVLGPRLGLKLHDKTLAKHKDDLLRLLYFGMTMAALGGIAARIEEGVVNTETGLSFIPLVFSYTAFYTFIFELLKDKDITLSVGLLDPSVPKLTIVVLLVGLITCVLVLFCLFITAYQVSSSFFAMYCGVFTVGFLLHTFMFLVSCFPGVTGRSFVHVHHWYWSVPLAHMCVFHTDVSMLSQAIFLAVHVHGVDCFGVEPLFYDTERRARHPSDFDWILKEHIHEKRDYDAYVPNEEEIILVLPSPHASRHSIGSGGGNMLVVDREDAAEAGMFVQTGENETQQRRKSSSLGSFARKRTRSYQEESEKESYDSDDDETHNLI